MQSKALEIVHEASSIYAAHAMCHPRERVGKFNFTDVLELNEIFHTPYSDFIQSQEYELIQFL